MCLSGRKGRLKNDREIVAENTVTFELLRTIAQDNADMVRQLSDVESLFSKLAPSEDKKVLRLDRKLQSRLARLRKFLTKESKKSSYKKSYRLLREIEIMAVERGCINRLSAPCDERDFVIEAGQLIRYEGKGGKVVLPYHITSIAPRAFSANNTVTEVVCNDGLRLIGESAFEHCRGLRSVTLPSTLGTISDSAFYNCSALTTVLMEEGVTNISHYAFGKCTALTAFRLPKSVVRIGDKAFFLDKKLPRKARRKIKRISSKAFG